MEQKISILSLDKKVKKEIDLGEGVITIFLPNNKQIEDIKIYLDKLYSDAKDKSIVTIDGRDMLFYVIPILTNLDYSNIENQTIIWSLIDNPPFYLKLVIEEIKEILNDISTLRTQEMKIQMKQVENIISQSEIVNNIPENVIKTLDDISTIGIDKTNNNYNKLIDISNKFATKKEETPEEKEVRELEERLQQLKNKKESDKNV